MNPLSKSYTGLFHLATVVLALVASVLTNPDVVDLGWTWVGPAASGAAALLLLLQRFTPIGDTP